MKKKAKKMTLSRETLRNLEDSALQEPAGAATQERTECGSCPASACHPTFCSPCTFVGC